MKLSGAFPIPPVSERTDGVHESAVHVGVEQVGHGQDGAVAQGGQAAGHSSFAPTYDLAFILNLAAVIQQVHEEGEVPAHTQFTQYHPQSATALGAPPCRPHWKPKAAVGSLHNLPGAQVLVELYRY